MSLELLKKSILEAPVVKKGDYYYVIHPITDGIPKIEPDLLEEVTLEMQSRIREIGEIDKIVTMEAMGIPLASVLSIKMDKPFTIIRKRSYGLKNELMVDQITGYSRAKLSINGLNKGDKIVIVDDVLSTGGTLKAVLTAFKKMGIIVKGVFIAIDKGNVADNITQEFNIKIDTLLTIQVPDGKVIIRA